MEREIVLDTETTGLDPSKGDRIIEIGAVELLEHLPTGNTFHVYLNPERKISEDSIRIHKITDAFVADKPFFRDIAEEFLSFLGNSPLVIHNAQFDLNFINHELKKIYITNLNSPVIDTLHLAREKFPGSSASLDSLCRRFNIDITTRTRNGHGALTDCYLLSEVYLDILGGKQPKLGLDSGVDSEKEKRTDVSSLGNNLIRQKSLCSRLSEADLKKHQEFIKEIGCEKNWRSLNLDQVFSATAEKFIG